MIVKKKGAIIDHLKMIGLDQDQDTDQNLKKRIKVQKKVQKMIKIINKNIKLITLTIIVIKRMLINKIIKKYNQNRINENIFIENI